MNNLYFVFDIESVGLHGEGFAVGWIVLDDEGTCYDSAYFGCPHEKAQGTDEDRQWIVENVVPHLPKPVLGDPTELRDLFWANYQRWKQDAEKNGKTLQVWAECEWPVEDRFLSACVDDNPEERTWTGPYPFHDVATALEMAGMDPLADYDRLEDELPEHNPLADARQSARLLLGAKKTLRVAMNFLQANYVAEKVSGGAESFVKSLRDS